MSLTLAQNRPHKWWAFAAIALGTFTSVVDHGAVFVALPTIATRFHTDLPTVQWVTLGYAAAISAALLPMGRLSDIIGRKQVYLSGFTIAIVSTAIAGFSTSILVLILAKVLHGIGVGMSQGTGMAMIASLFPENERGKALGTHLSVVGVGVIAGPALGGLLVSSLGWRWVFFFNIPAGVLAIATALVLLRGSSFAQGGPRPRFDWLGAAVSTAMLATFLLALANGPRIGWSSPVIIGLGLCSVILLAAFIWWEMHTVSPMLDLRLFKRWLFSLGISAGFIAFLTTSSIPVMMPFYLQAVLGYSPREVGLLLIPNAIALAIVGPVSGRLSDLWGWRPFKLVGLGISATGLFFLSRINVDSPLTLAIAGLVLHGGGMGMFNTSNNSSILSTVDQSRYGVVSSFLNLVRNSANVTGIALATAIVTATMASKGYPASLETVSEAGGQEAFGAFTAGLRTTFFTMGCLILLGIALSLVKGKPASASLPIGDR